MASVKKSHAPAPPFPEPEDFDSYQDLKHRLAGYQAQIVAALQKLHWPDEPRELYDPIKYLLKMDGKRIRPVLALMGADLWDGPKHQVMPAAIAVEVFHNFTLVHDDIMDQAKLRRGYETVHHKWDASTAILAGDAMLVLSYKILQQVDPRQLPACVKLFNETAVRIMEGQSLDLSFGSRDDVSIREYMKMIELKTACLLGASLRMGALLAGAGEADQSHLYDFGFNLGNSFQIQDDILDAFGDASRTGKRVGGDIAMNKKTFLILKALEIADPETKASLQGWMSILVAPQQEASRGDDKIEGVIRLLKKLDIQRIAEDERDRFFKIALENLRWVQVPADKKSALRQLAHFLIDRKN